MACEQGEYWENAYATEEPEQVSWFEETPTLSLELIEAASLGRGGVIDVGGGASRLAGALVVADYAQVAVLDLSANARAVAKAELGVRGDAVGMDFG